MGKTKDLSKASSSAMAATVTSKKNEVGDNESDKHGGLLPGPKKSFNVEGAIEKLLTVCDSTNKKVEDIAGRVLLLENEGYGDYQSHTDEHSNINDFDSYVSYKDDKMPRLEAEVSPQDSASMLSLNNNLDGEDNEAPRGRFDEMLTGFSKVESTGPPVDEKLAKAIELVFASGMSSAEYEAATSEILRPKNCDLLKSVRVNTPVWGVLNRRTRYVDEKLQEVQTSVVKAASELAQLMSSVEDESPAIRSGIRIIGLLGNANAKLNHTRRSAMRPDLEKSYAHLFTAQSTPDALFGEEGNKPLRETQYRAPQKSFRGRGRARGTPPYRSRGRSSSRGQGFRQRDPQRQ